MDLIPEQQACNQNTTPEQLRALAAQSTLLARLVCTNPNAEPDLLRELANRSDYKILLAVASNPNTPIDVLWEVGVEFPEEVLSNPVFPLLLLENPNLVEEIPNKTLESFFKVDLVPDSFINWVADNKKQNNLLLAITMNPNTSQDILGQLIINQEDIIVQSEDSYKHVIDAAKSHINWSGEIDANWGNAAFTMIKNTIFLCNERDVAAYKLGLVPESLIIKSGRHVFYNLASEWTTPIHVLEQIAEYIFLQTFKTGLSNSILIALATNPNTPLIVLEKLLGEYDISLGKAILREKVIYNPSISLTILQEFHSSHIAIKSLNTSPETLRKLAKSKWIHVSRGVAYHPNTPVDVLNELAEEPDEILHISLALNHNTTAEILNKIILNRTEKCHKYLSFMEAVICNINADEKTFKLILQENESYHLIKLIAYHPNVTVNILEELANIQSDAVLTAVATNIKTPTALLMKLARIDNNSIHMAVAGNPSTPKEILLELEAYKSKIFSKKAIKNHKKQLIEAVNPQIRAEKIATEIGLGFVFKEDNLKVLIKLAQHTDDAIKQEAITDLYQVILVNPDVSTLLLEQAAKISNPALEAAIIRHPNTSIEILNRFAKHRQANIRLLITKNAKITINLLKIFLEDKNKLVRESALAVYQLNLSEKDTNLDGQLQIVQNINTVSETLDEIATSKWLIIRERLALHPNTTVNTLIKLAEDKARHVQLAVAQNPNTPDEILEKLAYRHKWNTDVHTEAIKNLILRASKRASQFIGRYIKDSSFSLSRLFALLHPLAPTHLLIKNYRSSYWLERYAIAQNPNAPNYIRQHLTQDANHIVRAAAKANNGHNE